MKAIYEIGRDGAWTGETQSIGDAEAPPTFWTEVEPPQDRGPGDLVLWTGAAWIIANAAQAAAYWSAKLAPRKADLLAALAERRWQAETSGTVVSGVPIKTDRESTAKITAAYVQASANPAFTVRWKVDTGIFVTLDAATIIAIGDAVTAHVQLCFNNEDTLTTAILAAADHAALDAIDVNAGWPS